MDWIAISLGVLVAGALVIYLSRPWWMRHSDFQPDPVPVSNAAAKALSNRREALLTALRDLDFDYTVGKVTAEDYGPVRQALLGEVATIMTQLDEEQTAAKASLEAPIEVEPLAARQKLQAEQAPHSSRTGRPCLTCGRVSLSGDLYCRDCGTQLNAACPECGEAVHPIDHFCTSCGIELALALSG